MIQKVDIFLHRFTEKTVVTIIFVIVILGLINIVLRWFNQSLSWIDPLIRHLVFLSAFLGGALATGKGTHISIDLLSKYLEKKFKNSLKYSILFLNACISFSTLVWMIYASIVFCQMEWKYGKISFLGIHSGLLVGIIPIGLCVIAFRFLAIMERCFYKMIIKEGRND